MKLFLICSKYCYKDIRPIAYELINDFGIEVIYPNNYDNPMLEFTKNSDPINHSKWKAEMIKLSAKRVEDADAVLVLNLNIPDRVDGYIGGATMLEMHEAFRQNKKVFVYNPLPECNYKDELLGLTTLIIFGDLSFIPERMYL